MIFKHLGGQALDKIEEGWVPIPALGWVSATHEKNLMASLPKVKPNIKLSISIFLQMRQDSLQ